MDLASSEGHLNIIKWLHNNTNIKPTRCCFNFAAQKGYLDIIKYLNTHYGKQKIICKRDSYFLPINFHHDIIKQYIWENVENCSCIITGKYCI